ncbi:hypothetical protein TNCV_1790461 [Trichonephila clavipes]|nr:hypothetical protein TNCV_1790461 [Trichonephila clavipes]
MLKIQAVTWVNPLNRCEECINYPFFPSLHNPAFSYDGVISCTSFGADKMTSGRNNEIATEKYSWSPEFRELKETWTSHACWKESWQEASPSFKISEINPFLFFPS